MIPLKCCENCNNLKDGKFRNKLKCIFCGAYSKELSFQLYNEQKADKGCSTCKHCECKLACKCPSYIVAEECICTAGLECDTVLFTVKNCPKWDGKYESEE